MDIRERKIEKAGEGWSKHLDNTDFLSAGSNPEWNKTFVFTLSGYFLELTIKLMDSDSFSNDDFLGEAKIPLEPLFMKGRLPPTVYNVVKDHEYHGEIKVGLTFTPIVSTSLRSSSQQR
ncbi:elicitor-responsive protein 3 [Cocos nucifera]|uniref:Elicitor-responsive protein 3 n=1 Tax=Cocos nucifera TaxID=13894 RepID=A0A8K0N826_COCNU|nr:elicitor-responsive protein 3 [Cocos nucifera]